MTQDFSPFRHATLMQSFFEQGRISEWMCAFVMLTFALVLALPGDTFSGQGYASFRTVGLEESTVAVFLTLVALGRMAGLWINGRWHRSPLLRVAGAIVGVGVFGLLAMAFGLPYVWGLLGLDTLAGVASTGASTYTVLAIFDWIAARRSVEDYVNARSEMLTRVEG